MLPAEIKKKKLNKLKDVPLIQKMTRFIYSCHIISRDNPTRDVTVQNLLVLYSKVFKYD